MKRVNKAWMWLGYELEVSYPNGALVLSDDILRELRANDMQTGAARVAEILRCSTGVSGIKVESIMAINKC